jgi:L-lactate dehydrogenase complex protein LldE
VRVVEFGEGEQCCGFGGTFSVSFPHISSAMGALKLDHVRAAQPDVFVSGDMSCMMHMGGLAAKEGKPIKTLHIAQVLRETLRPRN